MLLWHCNLKLIDSILANKSVNCELDKKTNMAKSDNNAIFRVQDKTLENT